MKRRLAPLLAASLCATATGSAQESVAPLGNAGEGETMRLQEQALLAMEALQEELQVLVSLRDAQAALLAWNRESARTGASPAALPATLCRDPAFATWCPLLPATFGAASMEDGDG